MLPFTAFRADRKHSTGRPRVGPTFLIAEGSALIGLATADARVLALSDRDCAIIVGI
jgi:hypothetical protein